MLDIVLEGSCWKDDADVHDALLPALGVPEGHGRTLDALNDTIGGDDINAVRLPYRIHIRGFDRMGADARTMVERFRELITDLAAEGTPVAIVISPD